MCVHPCPLPSLPAGQQVPGRAVPDPARWVEGRGLPPGAAMPGGAANATVELLSPHPRLRPNLPRLLPSPKWLPRAGFNPDNITRDIGILVGIYFLLVALALLLFLIRLNFQGFSLRAHLRALTGRGPAPAWAAGSRGSSQAQPAVGAPLPGAPLPPKQWGSIRRPQSQKVLLPGSSQTTASSAEVPVAADTAAEPAPPPGGAL